MVMSTGIANVFTAFADDSVPVTVIKYWEDLGWNNNPDPPVHPHTFEFRWHDGTATNNIYLDPSSGFQALVQFSQTFINNLNNATDPYGLVSNHSVFDGQDWTGRFFDELGMSGYNTAVFIWDKETNTLRIFNSNADNFTLVHKEWIGGKAGANYSITLTATDYFGFEAHAATRADYIGGNYEGGSLSMTLNRDNGWSQPFFGITGGANWTVTEPQSNSWTSVTDPAQLIKYDDDEKEYYLYNIKNYVDTDIPVEKEWKNVPDGVTPPNVNVSITQEVEGIDQPVGTITLSNYDPGSSMSYGSFIGRLNGNYTLTENPVPSGYRCNGVTPVYDDDGNLVKYVIENEYIGNADRRVVKIWQDLPDGVTPPEIITVDLVGDDGSILETATLVYDPSTGQSEGWVSGNGQVVENPVPSGYSLVGITLKTDDEGNEYWEIVNKYDGGGTGGKDRRVVKIWEGLPDGVTPPATLEVTKLDADGNPIGTIILNLVPGTNTSEGYVGSDVYGLREDNVPAGYTFMGITLKTDDEGNEYWEIVNKYDGGGTGSDDKKIIKIWEDLPDGVTPPETLEITTYDADGNPIGTIILTLIPGTNTSEGFVGPEVYNISEDNVPPGYTFVGINWVDDGDGTGHWEIINKYIGGGTGKDTKVVKIWQGLPDGVTPPETITVDVVGDDGSILETVTLVYNPSTGQSEGWISSNGQVVENPVPSGYRLVSITWVDDDEGGHWEIINEYIGGGTGKDTRVVKIWQDLPDGVTPPETLDVTTLDADGNPIGTITLNLISGTYTSEGYVGPDVYGIREDNVPNGFTLVSITWVDDDDGGHWEIINKYIGGGTGKDTRVVKIWQGLPDGVTPPETITVDVVGDDGSVLETITLVYNPSTGQSEGWTSGNAGQIIENPVPSGYRLVSITWVDDDDGGHWEIINEYIGGKDTRVVKIWEGLPDGVTPPETLEVTTLDADGNPIGTVILYLVPGTNTSEGYVGPDVYGIREDNVPEGFTLVSITWVKDDDGGHWEIVNRYNKKPTPVIKNWLGRFPGEVPCTLTSVDVYDATGELVETVELTYDPETGTSIGYLTVTATEPLKFVENPVPDGWYYGGSSLKYDELGSAYYELINYRYYVADISISSVEVIRGQYLVWTIVTSESISWLRLDGIYTPEGGSRKKTSVIYKSDTTSSNIERTVENGVATWKIKMKFNYSEDVQSVIQSWTLSYKVADETAYRKANDDSPITVTVYKDESIMTDATGGYPSYSVVSVSGPETAAVGQYGTITVVTTSDCDKIRIGYDNGGKMKYATYQTTTKNNVTYVDDAETGLRTWTVNYKFATDATQYTVQGRGPKWDAEKAQNFTVNFG